MWCSVEKIIESHKLFLVKEKLFDKFRANCLLQGRWDKYINFPRSYVRSPTDMRSAYYSFSYVDYNRSTDWNETRFNSWHKVAKAFEEVMAKESKWEQYKSAESNDLLFTSPNEEEEETKVVTYKKPKKPSKFFAQAYAWSRQMGYDGYTLPQDDMEGVVLEYRKDIVNGGIDLLGSLKFDLDSNKVRAGNLVRDFLVHLDFESHNQVRSTILSALKESLRGTLLEKRVGIFNDLNYVESLAKTFGHNIMFDYENGGIIINQGGEPRQLTIKAFGRKFGFVKWSEWSLIAEKLKEEADKSIEIKYFTDYENLKKYYTMDSCSGDSCMRHSFSSIALHPCSVYAHDIEDYRHKVQSVAKYVSEDIKLAVLFENEKAIARVMVSEKSKRRGKAFGKGASILSKMLGYDDCGIKGCVNIIEASGGIIMPYIDGADYVDEDDGEIGAGGLVADSTDGLGDTKGIWSEYHGEYLSEDCCGWSEYHDSYINTEDYDAIYLEFCDDWVMDTDVAEELAIEYITSNASVGDILEFANRC